MRSYCLDGKTLSAYLDKNLKKDERTEIEGHISKCDKCLDLLLVAYDSRGKFLSSHNSLKNNIKMKLGLQKNYKISGNIWFIYTLLFFLLSFVLKSFFIQFLAIAVILGFKWVMDGEAAKKIIMIFKNIERKDEKPERKNIFQIL